ncbi:MAG TPA: DinB family protein [Chloroflexota bacterium]
MKDQAANADRLMVQVFSRVTPEQAAWRLPGSQANTIGATFMHTAYSADSIVHRILGSPPVFEIGGWRNRLGFDPDSIWTFEGKPDIAALLEYAQAVSVSTTDYLSSLRPDALEQQIETARGPQPLASRLSVYLVVHKQQHLGEIGALLGCQGVQGMPF